MIGLNTDEQIKAELILELTAQVSNNKDIPKFLELLNLDLLEHVIKRFQCFYWHDNMCIDPNYSSWGLCPPRRSRDNSFVFIAKDRVYQNPDGYFSTSDIVKHYQPLTYIETIKKLEELFDIASS